MNYLDFEVVEEFELFNKELGENLVSNYSNIILTKIDSATTLLSIEDGGSIRYIKLDNVDDLEGAKLYFYNYDEQYYDENTYNDIIENNYIVLFTPKDKYPIKTIRVSDEDWNN
ncbi:MAG: hypothetical protein GX660_24050 [Clostridiaceae bacterium]|nr:hypothetical protein [Clostridiaceae bacterium]